MDKGNISYECRKLEKLKGMFRKSYLLLNKKNKNLNYRVLQTRMLGINVNVDCKI